MKTNDEFIAEFVPAYGASILDRMMAAGMDGSRETARATLVTALSSHTAAINSLHDALACDWERQSLTLTEEAVRIRRSIKSVTDAEERCVVRADTLGKCASSLRAIAEQVAHPAPTTPAQRELSFATFRRINLQRCEQRFHPLSTWSVNDWATASAGEVFELTEAFFNVLKRMTLFDTMKKLHRLKPGMGSPRRPEETDHNVLLKKCKDEVGDVVAYLDLLCARLGFSLEDAVRDKFNAVSEQTGATERV